ncbi:cupin domain-containing protein [Pelagicoccus sp. SDUM812002]|uniref:cupin domain-containing protein n=1 Tax=Pelagicoccus sp. SDUM812002 TaxID=3041266 RepID=UPI002810057D|nr:cupin domain-containing protein [Pelagicoccus sp. SDUM812002]MDQ8187765.1 cupin domain-containing protein [Pelagicoccus sp. SDUM812002]
MQIVRVSDCPDYVAPDLAVAKEFMSPRMSGLKNLSIALITIPSGVTVKKHYHLNSEEVYHIVSGEGIMYLDGDDERMRTGDAVSIKVGQWHSVRNDTAEPLVMIVTCAPAWDPEDQIFENETR